MCRLAIFFAVIVLGFSPGVAFGATALLVGGEGGYAGLTDDQMSTAFGGYFQDYKRISVPFPGLGDQFRYSVQVGAENLYVALTDAMQDTDRPITIGGVSEGAPTVPEVLRRLMELDELGTAIADGPQRGDLRLAESAVLRGPALPSAPDYPVRHPRGARRVRRDR